MITVTDNAAEELKGILNRAKLTESGKDIDDDAVLRVIFTQEGGLALAPDQLRAGDQVVEHEGDNVLLVGVDLATALNGLVIDCEDTQEGRRLTISRSDEGPAQES